MLDVLVAEGMSRDTPPPTTADIVWSGGEGGLSVRADSRDPELFEPLRTHLGTGTSTTPGMVRWTLLIRLDRIVFIEHALPLEAGQTIPIQTLAEDIVFTGGGSTPTWWDDAWQWTEGSTTAARAHLAEAFDTELTTTSVSGTIEVRRVAPVELRVGLEFTTRRGLEVYWADVEFDSQRDQNFCR